MIAYKRISLAQHEAARETFEQSLALRQKAGAPEIESWYALGGLCQILVAAEEYERAEPIARRLFEMGERYDNLDAQGDGLHYFADCALLRGDYAEAEKRYVRALGHTWSCGLIRQSIAELLGIAMSAAGQGENARAVRLAVAAEAQREAIGIKPLNPAHWWKMLEERFIERAQSQLGADELDEAERAGRSAAFDAIVNDQIAGK